MRCISICLNKICYSHWPCILKFFQDVQCYNLPRFTYSLPHLLFYMTFCYHIFQTFSMRFMSCQFPSHSRTGIPLQSRIVLVLLELWHGARSRIYPFGRNTTPNTTTASIVMTVKYRLMQMRCVPTEGIYLYAIMHNS